MSRPEVHHGGVTGRSYADNGPTSIGEARNTSGLRIVSDRKATEDPGVLGRISGWIADPCFALLLFLGGVAWVAWVASRPEPAVNLVTLKWLQDALRKRGGRFKDDDIEKLADLNVDLLGDMGLFAKRDVERLLDSAYVQARMALIYNEVLGREVEDDDRHVDASGYLSWGSQLHQASYLERDDVERHLRRRIREMHQRGAK